MAGTEEMTAVCPPHHWYIETQSAGQIETWKCQRCSSERVVERTHSAAYQPLPFTMGSFNPPGKVDPAGQTIA